MDTVPPTPRIMSTRRNTVLPLIEAPLPTNTPDPSFTPPYLIRFSGHHEATINPKYDLIELSDSFWLHGEVPGVEDDIVIEFTDPQTMTIRGRSERSYASHIPAIGLIQGTMTRSAITKDSKISSLHETERGQCLLQETVEGSSFRGGVFGSSPAMGCGTTCPSDQQGPNMTKCSLRSANQIHHHSRRGKVIGLRVSGEYNA